MLFYIFALLLFIHGCIHLVGFAKGFNLRVIPLLTQNISRVAGLLWFITSLLFYTSTVLVLLQIKLWWLLVAVALIISEGLIIGNWRDAKPGSIINVIILILMIFLLAR